MVSGQVRYMKFITAIETDVFVTPEQELVFQRRIEIVPVDFAITGDNAGQFEHRANTLAIEATANFHHGIAHGPYDQVFYQERCSFFPG